MGEGLPIGPESGCLRVAWRQVLRPLMESGDANRDPKSGSADAARTVVFNETIPALIISTLIINDARSTEHNIEDLAGLVVTSFSP